MREIRIYQPGNYKPGETIELNEAAGQHVGVVLRMRLNDNITLFSGNNYEFKAKIVHIHKKKVQVEISHQQFVSLESPKAIHLAQALGRGDKMELVIQKAVELGVATIRPLITEYSQIKLDKERLEKKQAQWQAIAVAACEQCGRNQVPQILDCITIDEFLQAQKQGELYILHPYFAKNWREYSFASQEMTLLIGPEGGFSNNEVEKAKNAGFRSLSLGPRILRMETAAIAALSMLQAISGDL